MSIGCHLPQLDWTTQICLEIWVLSLVINVGKLGSPKNLMTVDFLYRWIFASEIRLLARLLAFSTRNGFFVHCFIALMVVTLD